MLRKRESEELVPVESSRGISPFEEMERLVDEAFRSPFNWFKRPLMPSRLFSEMEAAASAPSVDIYEDGDDLVVEAELPGMKKEDIKVSLMDDVLTISGQKKREAKTEKKSYYRLERSSGSFSRSFRLPPGVQGQKARATFNDGVLEMRIPKSDVSRKKEIAVQIG